MEVKTIKDIGKDLIIPAIEAKSEAIRASERKGLNIKKARLNPDLYYYI